MSTPRDLLIVAMDVAPDRPVESGDLSLALAGAEVVDLLAAEAVALDGELIVPNLQVPLPDGLLDEAASALVREAPYESVEDWVWRRGRGLSSAYLAALEKEGLVARQRGHWIPVRRGRAALVDSPARSRAADRWATGEPVLAQLAAAVGIREVSDEDSAKVTDEALDTVLATVHDAVTELEAVRQRKSVEDAAYDNVWRGM
ncbi:Golgi phosphoprotein 3 (GPP34) [Streptomyces sp. 3213]|uniref:GOLPH3/VPS74 family protein n=1 Tax=Streptomyces sp. 3213.3 TaxID=1855348 RepID=UPI000898A549|nr:GPP34 family phosphoprotein [Streptomyces sp. 3213.3]SEE66658.1 Golgi phosphoprotein 3 (GPP34) [Streptomyces sp. 3213] [Streptomyces sp. 3213.3]